MKELTTKTTKDTKKSRSFFVPFVVFVVNLFLSAPLLSQAPAQDASLISLPLTVDLGRFLPMVEAQVPKAPPVVEQWTEIQGKPRTFFRCNLYRDPLMWRFKDQFVRARTTVHYGMDIGVRTVGQRYAVMGSCGRTPEAPRRAFVEFETRWELRPDWTLDLKDPKATAQALDPCEITFLGLDITGDVTAGMQSQLKAGVEQLGQLARQNALLRQKAEEAWALACRPMELRKDVWLLLRPDRLRLGPIRSEGRLITIVPELQARPLLLLGTQPEAASSPLPLLEPALALDPGFHIRAEAQVDYAALSLQLTEAVGGQTFDTERGKITVRTIALAPAKGGLQLELDLGGALKGIVTLQGRPMLTPEGQLELKDLDFAVDKAGWMTKVGTWLFKSRILKALQEKSSSLLTRQFGELKALADSQLARELAPGVALEGRLEAFRLEHVDAAPEGLKVIARVDGQARLLVR